MTKIIPWTLPPVKGGSIGGYTERDSGSGGDSSTPDVYLNFEDATINYLTAKFNSAETFTTTEKDFSSKITGIQSSGITGVEVVDLTGVASIKCVINNVSPASTNIVATSENFVVDVDPITFALTTYVSGTLNVKTLESTASSSGVMVIRGGGDDGTLTFYVYNGNGEIIQTDEVAI